jgi:hypothetical protein
MPITGFKGVFEGNGKVISGLFINRPAKQVWDSLKELREAS